MIIFVDNYKCRNLPQDWSPRLDTPLTVLKCSTVLYYEGYCDRYFHSVFSIIIFFFFSVLLEICEMQNEKKRDD